MTRRTDFDVIVVGSGFGGSVMACRLAQAGLDVCLLERGKAYGPGDFARSPYDVSRNFWDPSEGRQGLFDIWSFSSIKAVVSSGLGGGSLIYANVLLRKPREWFVTETMPGGEVEHWPICYDDLVPHYEAAEDMLGAQRYPLDRAPYDRTLKTHALRDSAARLGLAFELPPLAVTFANRGRDPVPGEQIPDGDVPNLHGRPRSTCRLVGECDLGCNSGAKNSLDHTYLSVAQHAGADIRVRSEVRTLSPVDGGWAVDVVEHLQDNEDRRIATSQLPSYRLTSRRLVLSAGTLGTTFLLLKNRAALPRLSPMLGARFCGNGDYLGFAMRARRKGGGPHLLDPSRGPVITGSVRVPDTADGGNGRGLLVQDAGYPEFVNWIVQEGLPSQLFRLVRFVLDRGVARLAHAPRTSIGGSLSGLLSGVLTASSLPLLGMGRDVPDGWMRLRGGALDVDWRATASRGYFHRVDATMRELSHAFGARYVNPLWWLNLLVTVHPLGGCPMGEDASNGVVDTYGRVFGYEGGLYVADGSVMPGPVGANPSLTIAAVAERSAQQLVRDAQGTGEGA